MKNGLLGSIVGVVAVLAVMSLAQAPAAGQAPTAQAKTWSPPRLPDGQPDVQGIWRERGANVPSYDIEKGTDPTHAVIMGWQYRKPSSIVVDPADGKVPYQPWARTKREEIAKAHTNPTAAQLDPQARCYPDGVPRISYQGEFQILQPLGHVVFLYSFTHEYRVIPLDGRAHLGKNISLWMGDSRGHWEGNTLVVDVTNNNDKFWFDVVGDFHSTALHMVERFEFVNADKIKYEITIDDPNVYTRPWKIGLNMERNKEKGYELLEEACYEGNRDVEPLLSDANK